MKKSVVLKIGGSVIYDNALNINEGLLIKVRDWYYRCKGSYEKIIMVVGGGSISRDLQEKIASSVGGEEYLHSIGMSVTHTNANVLKAYIEDPNIYVPKKLGDVYELLMDEERKTIVCGGLKVGWSTDMDAALFADILGESKIHKISNIDYIYNKDPKTNEDAQPVKDMTWEEYFDLFGIQEDSIHKPNNSIPIDVECAIFCSKKGISFWIAGGERIQQQTTLENILSDGTLVHP
jgi:uridylate kinase